MTGPPAEGPGYTPPRMRLRVVALLVSVVLLSAGLVQVAQRGSSDPADAAGQEAAPVDAAAGSGEEDAPADAVPELAGGVAARAPLPERLAELVADGGLPAHTVGVSVTDADGRAVFGHRAEVPVVPASAQKLVVAAAALAALGPDHRYETVLRATAAPGHSGVLDGDLVLVGSGDPALGTPRYGQLRADRPRTPLEALADAVVAAGVTRITGGVVGDPRVFPAEPEAPGWLPRYLEKGNTSRSAGLTAEGGRRIFAESGRLRSEPAEDPAAVAAVALHGLLVERGVAVDGSAAATHHPPAAPVRLGRVASPPLLDLLRYTVQHSDNHLADAVFRTIGAASGDASWTGSATATRRALAGLGLDLDGTVLADGSGLSRRNRLSAAQLTLLDARMTASAHGRRWQSLMAVAGESGTLRRRLAGSVADGRLRGKTGSLQDVRSLSGAVVGPGEDRYHFAVVGNDLDDAGQAAVRRLQDHVALVLAEELYDCRWLPVPAPPGDALPAGGAEEELVCSQ